MTPLDALKHKILIVDDEPANLRTLERLFRGDYEVLTAGSGPEALDILNRHDVALIISDQRMPEMTGVEFIKRAALTRPQTVRMILSGFTDARDLVDAINMGLIYKYITKPWINSDLQQTVFRAVEHYETSKRQHLLAQEHHRLEAKLRETTRGFMSVAGRLISEKNPDIAAHCRRTAQYAKAIGERFGLEIEELEKLWIAALLHEIGRSAIQVDIDFDRESISDETFRFLKKDFEEGVKLLSMVADLSEVANIVRFQYEHFDGTGEFDGLGGEKIPLNSRILAVASAFDEINSGRRPELLCTDEEAVDWLRERSGSQFDPAVVEACLQIRPTTAVQAGSLPRVPNGASNFEFSLL